MAGRVKTNIAGREETNAFVVLCFNGKRYVPGAIVVAEALKLVGSRFPSICMVTDDVNKEAVEALKKSFNHVVEVPYISHPTQPMKARQEQLYGSWKDKSFTKWACLSLRTKIDGLEIDKVILLDADMLPVRNIDHLFELSAPAGCFSSAWDLHDAYNKPSHGKLIKRGSIEKALTNERGYAGCGGMILLQTSDEDFKDFLDFVKKQEVFGEGFLKCISGPDDAAISWFYMNRKWTHIASGYLAIPWKTGWTKGQEIYSWHYHGTKPWEMSPEEFSDLAPWWKVASTVEHQKDILFPSAACEADILLARIQTIVDANDRTKWKSSKQISAFLFPTSALPAPLEMFELRSKFIPRATGYRFTEKNGVIYYGLNPLGTATGSNTSVEETGLALMRYQSIAFWRPNLSPVDMKFIRAATEHEVFANEFAPLIEKSFSSVFAPEYKNDLTQLVVVPTAECFDKSKFSGKIVVVSGTPIKGLELHSKGADYYIYVRF